MKHLRFIYAAAAACALLASQPVLAAEQSFDTYGSAVITAGQIQEVIVMKHLRFIYAAAAACALLASQPVLAAEQSFDTYGSAVITAGQGAAQENSAEVPGGGSETVHFYGPGGQNAGDSKTPNTVQNEQAPATESEGPASSPVITAGEAGSPGQGQQSLSDPAAGGEQGGTESPEGVPSGELFPADQGMAQAEAVSGEQAAAAASGRVPAAGGEQGGTESPEGVPSGELFPADQGMAQAEAVSGEQAAAAASGRVVDPSRPMVALTFDDGPQPSVGNRIMDCLAQYGGKATFFMVGERVGSYAAEVQRMVAEGHEVANHSMNHKYFQKLGPAQIQAQVSQANDAIEAACGVRPKLMRLPGGNVNNTVKANVNMPMIQWNIDTLDWKTKNADKTVQAVLSKVKMRLPGGNVNNTVKANVNMPMIQWNIDTLDWKTKNADKTVQAVLSKVKDGDIVLMHELYSQSGDAAVRMIPELVNRGFQLVTVSEMAAAKGKNLEPGKLYSSMP